MQQGEVTRDGRVLVDAARDLLRTEDHAVLGKNVGNVLPVVGAVAAGREPRNQVGLPVWRERHDQEELRALLAGQPEQDVVGLHRRRRAPGRGLGGRHVPHVLTREEDFGIGHVIGRVDGDLHIEEIFRSADVGANPRRHRRGRLEEGGEGRRVCLDQGIFRVHHVEGRHAFVGVDDHLHGVADVVDVVALKWLRLRVRVRRGRRVSVHDPVQAAVDRDDVGVRVERQERRELLDAVADVAPVQHQRLVGDLARDEQAEVAELQRPQRSVDAVHWHSVRAGVAREDVLAALRVVELARGGRREDIVSVGRADLAEVDRGLGDLDSSGRRQVLYDIVRQALADHGVDGARGHAVSVGVGQALVEPVLR